MKSHLVLAHAKISDHVTGRRIDHRSARERDRVCSKAKVEDGRIRTARRAEGEPFVRIGEIAVLRRAPGVVRGAGADGPEPEYREAPPEYAATSKRLDR